MTNFWAQLAAGVGVAPSAAAGSWRSSSRLSSAGAPATHSAAPDRQRHRGPRMLRHFSAQPHSSSVRPDRTRPALAASAPGAVQPSSVTTAADSRARRWPADCSRDSCSSHLYHYSHRPTSTRPRRVSGRQSLEHTANVLSAPRPRQADISQSINQSINQ